jgi:hypothetical protein
MDEEADARAINTQPWEPPPGMAKQRCPNCRQLRDLVDQLAAVELPKGFGRD